MTAIGYVKKINDDTKTAVVEIKRQSSCGESCAGCGLCQNPPIEIEAENRINAVKGDKVEVFSKSANVLINAFLLYIMPLLILISGIAFVTLASANKVLLVLIFLIAFAIWFIIIKLIDKKIKEKNKNIIVKKL